MAKKVYISIWNKSVVLEYLKVLMDKFDYIPVSSGDTLDFLKKKGIETIDLEDLILNEMVETKADLENFICNNIDMAIVKFRDVQDVADKTDDVRMAMGEINILDSLILRIAAKNFESIIPVCDYSDFYSSINVNSYDRQKLALKAFQYLADYDANISEQIGEFLGQGKRKLMNMSKLYEMKYGENPHQKASLYIPEQMADYEVLTDQELKYNDILNLSVASKIISEFYDVNAVAISKHNLPCGVALGKTIFEAYTKAFDCDPFATFSGTVAFSKTVDMEVAKHLTSMSVKVVLAPDYDKAALEHLTQNNELKIVKLNTSFKDLKKFKNEESVVTSFGTLVQDANNSELDKDKFKVVTKTMPTSEQLEDAIFAWKVVKYSRTNSVVIAKDFKTVAITQGQTNLISASELALDVACENSKDAVMATDEAIPTGECINAAVQGRISLIIQPGGTIHDSEVIKLADKYGIAMVMTGIRNLKF